MPVSEPNEESTFGGLANRNDKNHFQFNNSLPRMREERDIDDRISGGTINKKLLVQINIQNLDGLRSLNEKIARGVNLS